MELQFGWKTGLLIGGSCLVLGLGLGMWLVPEKPVKIEEKLVYQDKIKVVEVVKWQTLTKTEEKIIYVKQENKNIHTNYTKTVLPDGTKTVTKTTSDTSTVSENQTKEKIVEVEKVVYKDRVIEGETKLVKETKTEFKSPKWMLSASIGTRPLDLQPSTQLPYFQPLIVGVGVDKHLLGPVWLGVVGYSDWSFHLKLTGAF